PLLEQLLPFADQLDVVVLCGRRADVRVALELWAAANPALSLRVLGFQRPEAMVELYRTAWAHVARPGARTATEALFMGCPLIFNRIGTTMPQELLAPRYFKSRGLELSLRHPRDLALVVRKWLDNPEHYQALRNRYRKHRLLAHPSAVIDALTTTQSGVAQ
ncbi:MAG: hypothetical protein ACKO8I_17870, partial [Cyanobacteriota bacterium]